MRQEKRGEVRLTLRSIWAGCLALAVLFATAWLQMRLESGRPAPPPQAAAQSESPAQTPPAPPVRRTRRVLDGDTVRALDMRTYALWCAQSGRHENADVCTDYRCCQAWKPEDALREAWGAAFDAKAEKLRAAVDGTAGEVLRYAGQPVFAAFHSSSAGFTEDSGAIWSELPYLVSVESPEDAEVVPGYVSEAVFPALDFRDTLLYAKPEADLAGEPERWLGAVERDGSGRVAWMELGGVRFSGTELRGLFALRSTAFTLSFAEGRFTFTVTGFGHGVGMSQYGAQTLASRGWDYAAILAHYYPGTELVKSVEFGEWSVE